MKKIIFMVMALCMLLHLSAQTRGLKSKIQEIDKDAVIGKQYLVLIAVNKYKNWFPLTGPVKDAKDIKNVLTDKYYIDEVMELYDEKATKRNIMKLFLDLQKKMTPRDSLLIFYAGHGHLDDASNTGFWIPCDAGEDELLQENWIPNSQVRGLISKIESKHILLISDSCFSGDILNVFRAKAPDIDNDYFKNAYTRRSRQVLTSGSSEFVADKSSFARELKYFLRDNTKAYVDPIMMFSQIRLGVEGQQPLYGELKGTGHQDGGSFLLFLKEDNTPEEVAVVEEEPEEIVDTTIVEATEEPLPETVPLETPDTQTAMINDQIASLEDVVQTMEIKTPLYQKIQKPVAVSAGLFTGLTSVSLVSSFIFLGVQYANFSLNQSAANASEANKYMQYTMGMQTARNAGFIVTGVLTLPTIILYIVYGSIKTHSKRLDNNKRRLEELYNAKKSMLAFDISYYEETINISMTLPL